MRNQEADQPALRKLKPFSTAGRLRRAFVYATVMACLLFLSASEVRADDYTLTFFSTTAGTPYITYIDNTTGVTLSTANACNPGQPGFTLCSITLSGIAAPFTTTIPFNIYGLVNIAQQANSGLIADQLSYGILSPSSVVLLNFMIFPQGPSYPSYLCANYGGCGFTQGAGIQLVGSIAVSNDPITVNFQSSAPAATVPEPSSALFTLTGFAGLAISSLRRWVARRSSRGS